MGMLTALLATTLTLLAALVVAVSAALPFPDGLKGAGVITGCLLALLLCVGVPVWFDRLLTRAARRKDPSAKSTLVGVLGATNAVLLAALVGLFPSTVRHGLQARLPWLGAPPPLMAAVSSLAAHIPRSQPLAPATEQAGEEDEAEAATEAQRDAGADRDHAQRPQAASSPQAPAQGPSPQVAAQGPAGPLLEAPPAPESVPAKVFADRADSVVVVQVIAAAAEGGVLAELGSAVQRGAGSGFFVAPDGLIVTNYHVVESVKSARVELRDGRHFDRVHVQALLPEHDLALLSIDAQGMPVAPLRRDGEVTPGTRAIAIGSPLGLQHTLTDGIVSALRVNHGTKFIQMQTTVAPGSSGGPLFDASGEVIGVNTAVRSPGLNLAVRVDHVRELLAAPREPKALEPFEAGAQVLSIAAEGGALPPVARMQLELAAGWLLNLAEGCVRSLPPSPALTIQLPAQPGDDAKLVTNLGDDAEGCLSRGLDATAVLRNVFDQAERPDAVVLQVAFGHLDDQTLEIRLETRQGR